MQRLGFVTTLSFSLLLGCDVGQSANLIAENAAAGGGALGGSVATNGSSGNGSVGGSSGAGGPATAPSKDEDFELLFRDDFDSFDISRWQLMTHSWASNLALFSTEAAAVSDGMLTLSLTPAPTGTVDDSNTPKPFLGAEVRSLDTLTYGRVRARAKLASGSAVVSSLVTIYTPWPADNWNELDIEHLGAKPNDVQLNAMVYTGPPTTPPVATAVTPAQDPLVKALGFDASADFHVYTIEWTPNAARFLVDDTVLREWTTRIDLMTLPQNVLMTIWASNSVSWAGAVTEGTGQASAVYDWIELYRFMP
jgi:beta-glucanase (GH16 family)